MFETRERILIVEDETVVALDIRYTLSDLGYAVVGPVTSAESALALLEKDRVDLVLMDIHLKGEMTGIDAAGIVRERYDIPVVFLTAYADESTLAYARTVEPYGYVLKPFTKRELSSNIEIALYKHRSESKLRASEQRWNSLAANVPNMIVILGADGKIQYNNKYPLPSDHLAGVDIFSYILPEYHERVRVAFQKGLQGETSVIELWANLPGDVQVCYEAHIGPIFEKERVTAVTHILNDITARKRAEREREDLIASLTAKNAELDRFAYRVSHDLRAPLMTVQGFLGYLDKDLQAGEMDKIKQDMSRIGSAVGKMQAMLVDLLELSRIGRIVNPPERVPFAGIVSDTLELLHGRLEARGVQVDVQAGLPEVYVDRQRMVGVLQNLIDNSAKYMGDQKRPLVTIGMRGYAESMPIFMVQDNGMGIAPENYSRIFELFSKLNQNSEGTGIGLSLVKRIVEFHGGHIWVESEVGAGSTFLFSLPPAQPA
jgi:PAS domain S-box-containing protein